jgi:hypothetical protein
MKIKSLILSVICVLPLYAHAIELSPKEKELVVAGKLSKDVQWRKKFVWPKVTIKALIPGTPEQNMKGFTQFETHTEFIPDLIKSKIVATPAPNQWHVSCVLKVPWPVSTSAYTTNNVVTVAADGTQTLVWNMVKGDLIKATDGHITFQPYEGKSLLEYESQIVPDSGLAGMFKSKVEGDIEATVKAIIKNLAKKNSSSPQSTSI